MFDRRNSINYRSDNLKSLYFSVIFAIANELRDLREFNVITCKCSCVPFANTSAHFWFTLATLEGVAMMRLNLFWRLSTLINRRIYGATVKTMTYTNDHASYFVHMRVIVKSALW